MLICADVTNGTSSQLKTKQALEFLRKGHRVRVMVAFPGRRGFDDAKRMMATLVSEVPADPRCTVVLSRGACLNAIFCLGVSTSPYNVVWMGADVAGRIMYLRYAPSKSWQSSSLA